MPKSALSPVLLLAAGLLYFAVARLGILLNAESFSSLVYLAPGLGVFMILRFGLVYAIPIFISAFILRSPENGFIIGTLVAGGRVLECILTARVVQRIYLTEERFGELREAMAVFAGAIVTAFVSAFLEFLTFFRQDGYHFTQSAATRAVDRGLAITIGFMLVFPLAQSIMARIKASDSKKAKALDLLKTVLIACAVTVACFYLIRSVGFLAFFCVSFPVTILVAALVSPLAVNATLVALASAATIFSHQNSTRVDAVFTQPDHFTLEMLLASLSVLTLVLQSYIRMVGRKKPAAVMLTGAVIGSMMMWWFSQRELLHDNEHAENIIGALTDEVADRSHDYVSALSSTAAFWETYEEGAGEIRPEVWENYSHKMKLPQRFPRLRRIGLMLRIERKNLDKFVAKQQKLLPGFHIRRIPTGILLPDSDALYVVSAPSHGTHLTSYGLDYATEKHRKDAADVAAQIHGPKISDRIELASTFKAGEPAKRDEGFSMVFPLYTGNNCVGWVLAAYSFDDFFSGATRSGKDEVAWTIAYASEPESPVYQSAHSKEVKTFPLIKRTSITLANTDFVMSWYRMPGFISSFGSSIIWLMFLMVSASITATATMTNLEIIKSRALKLAERISHDLEKHRIAIFHSSKMSSLGHMAAGIAHEINNPLTVITGLAYQIEKELEQNPQLKPEVHERQLNRIERINFTVGRIAAIIRGLQSFSRSGASAPRQMTPVSTIMETVLDLSSRKFSNSGIDLRVATPPDIEIFVVGVQIEQILMNLLINSFDAVQSLAEKWIEIKFELKQDWFSIVVTDSGSGVPEDVAARIMEPFFTTKPLGKGTGLGLSICRGILEAHGGNLVYVKDAKHTQFRIELPRLEDESLVASK